MTGAVQIQAIEARLFLVGCPRSGTTLLQSMLAAHSRIASFPESHFLLVTSRTRRGRWMRKLGLVSPEMRQRLQQFLTDVGRSDLMPVATYRLRPFIQNFADILDHLTAAEGKSIWLEKTPGHLYYIDDFARVLSEARFIHLIRNGADVVASLYEVTNQHPEQWGEGYTVDQCVRTWQGAVALSKQYYTLPNHLWVAYEELVAAPVEVLQRICDFIGIAWEAEMIGRHAERANGLILAHESWKSAVYQTVSSAPRRKFTTCFTPHQQAAILEQLSKVA